MKPTFATLCLLRIGFWHSHVHYCIQVALECRRKVLIPWNTDWWIERAKLHAQTAKIHANLYQEQLAHP
jgi:hypothetical protein